MRGVVVILCPGQGGQHPGMFDLAADCPEAGPMLAVAAGVLGRDPRRFVREAPPAELFSDFPGRSCAARRPWLHGPRLARPGRRAP